MHENFDIYLGTLVHAQCNKFRQLGFRSDIGINDFEMKIRVQIEITTTYCTSNE